jgi:hypothetical protein
MDLAKELWPDWSDTKRSAHYYAIRCMGHRFRKFGFEESVNMLDPKSLLVFAMCVHEPMASACIRRAIACDPSLSGIIKAPICQTSSTTG